MRPLILLLSVFFAACDHNSSTPPNPLIDAGTGVDESFLEIERFDLCSYDTLCLWTAPADGVLQIDASSLHGQAEIKNPETSAVVLMRRGVQVPVIGGTVYAMSPYPIVPQEATNWSAPRSAVIASGLRAVFIPCTNCDKLPLPQPSIDFELNQSFEENISMLFMAPGIHAIRVDFQLSRQDAFCLISAFADNNLIKQEDWNGNVGSLYFSVPENSSWVGITMECDASGNLSAVVL